MPLSGLWAHHEALQPLPPSLGSVCLCFSPAVTWCSRSLGSGCWGKSFVRRSYGKSHGSLLPFDWELHQNSGLHPWDLPKVCLWLAVVGCPWLDARCPQKPLCRFSSSAGQGGENTNIKYKYKKYKIWRLMGWDKDRDRSLTNYRHGQNRLNLGKFV